MDKAFEHSGNEASSSEALANLENTVKIGPGVLKVSQCEHIYPSIERVK